MKTLWMSKLRRPLPKNPSIWLSQRYILFEKFPTVKIQENDKKEDLKQESDLPNDDYTNNIIE